MPTTKAKVKVTHKDGRTESVTMSEDSAKLVARLMIKLALLDEDWGE